MQDPRPAHDAKWFNALAMVGLSAVEYPRVGSSNTTFLAIARQARGLNPLDVERHPVRMLDGMAVLNQA